jgi:hypothetical protein
MGNGEQAAYILRRYAITVEQPLATSAYMHTVHIAIMPCEARCSAESRIIPGALLMFFQNLCITSCRRTGVYNSLQQCQVLQYKVAVEVSG